MIKITVEGPRAVGKSYFIRHYLMPAIEQACKDNFQVSMNGFKVVERFETKEVRRFPARLRLGGGRNSE